MKLEIEKFISEMEFPEAAMSLIEEGILCYKAGAYKSAYIMSYLCSEVQSIRKFIYYHWVW
ncbi:hypothetical protein P4J24_29145 [Bacillus anthracis]|uniref:hypothetical protein n=1 Tax=Bacillus cereus group TaxID=86661 RepID=UPI00207BBEA3|nr:MULTISPECIES: hypothetical protein [Bacillus cereus group]MEB9685889.1 hypothetical protein [Bacillus anthracis]